MASFIFGTKLNTSHPDYPAFMAEFEAEVAEYRKQYEAIVARYPKPVTPETGLVIARETAPLSGRYLQRITAIQEKYQYLYE